MMLFSSQPGDDGLPGPTRARVMAAIMTTTLMGVFDGTMINIALPSMAQEMQVPASYAVWFANGYLLAAAMTLAIFAALAARLGYRPVFLAGLTTFTLTSLGCALAKTPEVLIGMRVLQGIGGAATLSIAPAILRSVFPGRLLGRILGLHALLIASSSAIGPVLGGTILHTLSWQWLFAINVLPGTLALLLAVKALPRDAVRKQAPFDTLGAILSALLLGSTIVAANSLHDATYHTGSLCWTVLAALSGMAFIWQIRRTDNPLLPPAIFKNERVSRDYASYASGVLSIMRTFGQCLGAAAVGVLLATNERAIHAALWIAAAASAVAVIVSASRLRKITHPAETG
ncbi:MFS transporter [Enterobacter hormaechei]|uniref:MFS transporter n=1 Tax=Enterobacter cloacae complex TaxID=354276 RepID=UPI0004474945|nr:MULTISPECIES: MFS transporter [Enterobacter cloacae complex]EKM8118465.1 MFS transporter [Enterobacter hormaechei]EUM68672.1 transport system protein [Enterobacter hormaechei subsp. hoffmannii MGH 13]EUM97597.1 transport system protein [Enterobacter sp. MGH 4]TWX78614.1 MFS transporter [Enterobacter hormaechei]